MPADNLQGWRRDVTTLIQAMHPPVLRYPGGNFVSGYRWQDGIGDRDRRPIRFDRAWKVWEPNDVGTDEFMQLCQLLNTEAYISVNAGDGTAEEAAAWVAYCNAAPNNVYGAQRANNGHATPYSIRYWGIGNEMYGNWQIGHVDGETFANRHNDFAYAMRAVDSEIILLGVGDMPDRPGYWLETLTEIAGANTDLMTVHHYTGVPEELDDADRDALATACPLHIESLLADTAKVLDDLCPEHHIDISFDEWNIVHRGAGRRQNYALRDGLYAAGMFNAFQRQSARLKMANIAQLVNLLGVIETTKTDVYGTPIYWAFCLYQEHCGQLALETETTGCPTFDLAAIGVIPAMEDVPYLDAVASLSRDGKWLSLAVINRHAARELEAEITLAGAQLTGDVQAYVLDGPDMGARNSVDEPERVGIVEGGCAAGVALCAPFGNSAEM
jgi:alpha-N-arabinofuranosidase